MTRAQQFVPPSTASQKDWNRNTALAVNAANAALSKVPYTPEEFGAAGDGVTDDYAAFIKLFAAASSSAEASIQLGKNKTYYIGQYAVSGNGVSPLAISNATGLTFDGNGATISFKGNFDRNVSTTSSIGLQFIGCAQCKFFNFTVDGNADLMTNSSGSAEAFDSYNMNILGCTDCTFENIETHHSATDGIAFNGNTVSGVYVGSKRCVATNVNSHHNARSNISVFTAEYITFKHCRATYGGVTGGSYPGHSPLCGLDIEPDKSTSSGADINCNNIVFEDCYWSNNTASDINGVLVPNIAGPITFARCTVIGGGTATATINIGAPGIVFRDCYLDMKDKRLELPGGSGSNTHLFENCDILGTAATAPTIYCALATKSTRFRNCRITCTATAPKTSGVPFMAVANSAFVMENCDISVPAAWFLNEGSNACKVFDVVMKRAERNTYTTTLATAGSYFYTKWNTTPVFEETYTGQAVGTADTFRPTLSATFDTNRKYTNRSLLSTSSTLGLGYGPGAGGTVTQATSKSTGVTLNTVCGAITMNAAALAANTTVTFTLTNSNIAADDELAVRVKSGFATAATYRAWAEGNASGSRTIVLQNISAGSLSEAVVLGFALIKATTAAA